MLLIKSQNQSFLDGIPLLLVIRPELDDDKTPVNLKCNRIWDKEYINNAAHIKPNVKK